MSEEKLQKLSEITQELTELSQAKEMESLLKDNVFEFEHNNETYKVSKPTPGQLREIQEAKAKKYTQLAMDDDYLFEEKLREIYKKKGVDLDELDRKILELERREHDLKLKLAKQTIKKDIDNLKELILDTQDQKNVLFSKKCDYLQYSIETQVGEYANEILVATILMKKEDDKWVRAFKSHEDLLNCEDQKLIIRGTYYLSLLVYRNEY